jgi:two-component system sensor histidine kinase YesM
MRRFRPFFNSLRTKLFAGIVFIIVPLVTVLIINNYYSVHVVRNQVAQSNKNLLSLYMGQIDRNLLEVDNYLYALAELNTDLVDLEYPEAANYDSYTKAKLRLFYNMTNEINYKKSIDLFFIYSAINKELIITPEFEKSYEERTWVKEKLVDLLQQNPETYVSRHWYYWHSDGRYYLFHLLKQGNVYVGAWVNVEKLMIPIKLIDFGQSGAALLATDKLEPMNLANKIREENIQLRVEPGPDPYYLTGNRTQYLVIREPSARGNFNLIALVPDGTILERLPYLQKISSIISIAACAFLLLFLFFMRKVFLLPINRIVRAMTKLRNGQWESRLQQYPTSTEFEIMNETFNHMIKEIRELKINVYEEKLNHQRAELKQLQLQINPHFFMNSLNIIYNLATVKDFALIQEMAKCLVLYFRFIFRSGADVVPLKDELSHTANYLRIQQLRFPGSLSFRIDVPEELLGTAIPPLVIQSMVENSVKYAVNLDKPVEIEIRVSSETGDRSPRIHVEIQDTGAGFPALVLQQLQAGEELAGEEGEHIGIWNVKRRLRLLYPDQSQIDFSNEPGATVRIRLPLHAS